MRLGSIDLGSNSIHLQVVDVDSDGCAIQVELLRSSIRMGGGWKSDSTELPQALQEEALSALSGFTARCAILGCDEIICTATAALRDASNSLEFIERLNLDLGISIQVLTGNMEALLVKDGTRPYLPEGAMLFDMGGRSTEIVTASPLDRALSIAIGHLTLSEEGQATGMRGDELVDIMLSSARSAMKPQCDAIELSSHAVLASPSGAVRTLARMTAANAGEEIIGNGTGYSFDVTELDAIVTQLSRTPEGDLADLKGIDMRRASSLLAAGCIIRVIMELTDITRVVAVPGGLREGIVQKWINSHEYRWNKEQ